MLCVKETWVPPTKHSADLLQYTKVAMPYSTYSVKASITRPAGAAPARVFSGTVSYAVFHNGASYTVYAIGNPNKILQKCELSENIRERAVLEVRRMQNDGDATIVATAHGECHTLPATATGINGLQFDGLIALL